MILTGFIPVFTASGIDLLHISAKDGAISAGHGRHTADEAKDGAISAGHGRHTADEARDGGLNICIILTGNVKTFME